MGSLGFVETKGYVPAFAVADAADGVRLGAADAGDDRVCFPGHGPDDSDKHFDDLPVD